MKQTVFGFAAADREFYAPLTSAPGTVRFTPTGMPDGWLSTESGIWTTWYRPGLLAGVEEGWKVHVSARPERVTQVLDIVSAVCVEEAVVFKHITTKQFYWWTHQKHAIRAQAGKFIAAFPTSTDAAGRLMERLRIELADEDGPYILNDRRFKDSRTVHYRYGGFTPRFQVNAEGYQVAMLHDVNGELIADRRRAGFHLPEGITDPFIARKASSATAPRGDAPGLGGFAVDKAIAFTNAGGAYRGHEIATGRPVFIKEGRAHTGLRIDDATATEQLREEWAALTDLHERAPGVAPEPISYFRRWEHEFLVTEVVSGIPLWQWLATTHPMFTVGSAPAEFTRYYERCEKILTGLERELARLHTAGYVFVDVSPGNVLVGDDDTVRLVDFGSAHKLGTAFLHTGTLGYSAPAELVGDDLTIYDHYGVSSVALQLTGPLHFPAQINPDTLTHLRHDVSDLAPVPAAMWRRVTRYLPPSDTPQLPGPEEVAADPIRHLTDLRDRVADALVAMADIAHPDRVFPTVPEGYLTNAVCVGYGTAGVIHALRHTGRPLPAGLMERFRLDAIATAETLAPGLDVGTAGIARVLADCGDIDSARHLLAAADRHPITSACATLAGGAAGVAMAHLALHGHTGDDHHVERAIALVDGLPDDARLTSRLGADDATGLLHGRAGVALTLQQLAAVTGDAGYLRRAIGLLHAELDRAIDPDAPGLVFPISATDRRAVPYLYAGTAGLVYATTRCLQYVEDDRLTEAMPRMLASLRTPYTIMAGLYQGMAGLAFALADHARLTGDETSRQSAIRSARGLFKFALPHPTGVRFLGDQLLRCSAELWSGSAGILLALNQVLNPGPDGLFAAAPATVAPDRRASTAHMAVR